MPNCYELTTHSQTIDLANLYVFTSLYKVASKEKEKHRKLVEFMDLVLAVYSKQFPKLCDERKKLQLEIRLITKGTPVTEPIVEVPDTIEAYDSLSESQRQAFTELLKKAYKSAAMICHPDKGGDVELFQELKDAYSSRDLTRVTSIWISVTKGRNLYWQQSEEGIDWASTELNRPMVQQEKLKATPLYAIVKNHVIGRVFKANDLMHAYLLEQIQSLLIELNHLRTQHGNQGKIEGIGQIEIEGCERIEIEEGPDSTGEGPLGPCVW